jgi:hypothetical protein
MDLEMQALSDVNVDLVSVTASEGARRATGEAVTGAAKRPEPEVVAVARRRRFSMGFKRRVVHAADGCKEPGEVGALLRGKGCTARIFASGARRSRRWRKCRGREEAWPPTDVAKLAAGRWRCNRRLPGCVGTGTRRADHRGPKTCDVLGY